MNLSLHAEQAYRGWFHAGDPGLPANFRVIRFDHLCALLCGRPGLTGWWRILRIRWRLRTRRLRCLW